MTELRKQINNIVEDHQECLVLAKSVGSTDVYEGTTATAEDIKEGKTAYSNGKKITGTLPPALDTTLMTGTGRIFSQNTTMEEAPIFDTQNIKSMEYMFFGCTNLKKVRFL